MKTFVKQFDLFSKPFVFFVGDKKNKSTFIGGSLSLSIILISIVYFYYLINLYLTNKVEPKINSSISIENDRIEINIDESFFIFEMLIQGEPLKQYEKRVGQNFLTYTIYYETFNSKGECIAVEIPYAECQDPKFAGFQCSDIDSIKEKNIYLQPIQKISSDFALAVHFCDPLKELNCATQEEINSTILQSSNYFQVYTKIRQYNPTQRSYKDGYKSEYFYFDLNSVVYTRISLIKATTTVTEGFLIQASESSEDIFDFKRVDTYFSREKIYDRMGIDGFAYIVFEINQVRNIIVVQHAMITEVLAQFMSIFNSLLTIGILARLLAESHIVEDMNSILLKEYYKKTALQLVSKREQRKSQQLSLGIKQKEPSLKKDLKDKSHSIAQMQKKINDTNFAEQSRQLFEMSYFQRFKIFVFQLIGLHPKIDLKDHGTTDSQIYQRLLSQSVKRINIYEVYKDLIKLKMSVKLMLTKEQYAAMQFCGSDIFLEDNQRKPEIQLLPPDNSSINQGFSEAKNCLLNSPANSKQVFLSPTGNVFSLGQNVFKDSVNIISPMLEAPSQDQEYQDKQSARLSFKNNEISNNHQNDSFYQLYPQLKRESNINEEQLLDQQSNCTERQNFQPKSRQSLGKIFSELNKSQISKNEGDNIELEDSQIVKANMQNTQLQENQQKKKEKSPFYTEKDSFQRQLQINQIMKNDNQPNSYFEGCQNQHKSHLYEMDSIEENEDLQEELLSTFLNQIRWKIGEEQDLGRLSQVDRQIFQSLLTEEGQISGIKYEKKEQWEENKNNNNQKNENRKDIEEKNNSFHKINILNQEQQSELINPQKINSIDFEQKNYQIIEEKQTANSFKSQNSQDKQPVDSNLQSSMQVHNKHQDLQGKQEHRIENLKVFN